MNPYYISSSNDVSYSTEAGYKAIFLTVDTPYLGRRFSETRNAFALPSHLSLANFAVPNLKNKGASTPNRGEDGQAKVPDNNIVKVVKEDGPKNEPGRADTLSDQGLPNFGVAGEDGAVDGNGEFSEFQWIEGKMADGGLW